ncbi:importin subunit alpha-1 [Brachionus plicatilis]|uniref:Importin subunit alpha n=1 Tax=Brachionus plicatilis TaxID=10195 RepID=A0A3M7PEJ9_BRAPC|nr:importin subunit alpha-1 [Brachionus plicatilis]
MLEHGSRLKSFKNNGRDLDDLRRRRTESSIELRKQKKEDQVLKRRNITLAEEEQVNNVDKASASNVPPQANMNLNEIIEIIHTTKDNDQLFPAVQSIRKMLSRERNPPIDDVIKANLVHNLVSYLACEDHAMLQFEAAWALTNIASGTSAQTRHVVESGAVTPFIKLLSSPNSNVCEQAVWALGNIAGDGAELRDMVIKCGIVEPLLALIRPDTPNTFLRNITWTLSNLCRNKNPAPSMQVLQQLLPSLSNLLYSNDKEVLTDTCWALSYITDGPNEKIDAVIKTGVVPRLIELLNLHHKNEVGILSPALRCIGNIVTGSDDQTQCVIDSNALPIFHALLTHNKIGVQKEAAWTLSNITAGTQTQIQAVIQAELVPLLVHVLTVGELRVQKEAAWAITNFTSGASTEQVLYLVQCQVIKPMCDLMTAKDPKLIKVLLDGLCNILLVAEKVGQLEQARIYIEEIDGLTKIEKLQENENEDVYKLAYHMVEKFFSDEGEEQEGLQPEMTTEQYNFTATETTATGGDSAMPKFSF